MRSLNGETIVCDQHHGEPVQLRIYGDEFYARYETDDGFTVVYDTSKGCYCYAPLASGSFASSGASACDSPPAGFRRHLKETPEVRNDKFGQRYRQIRAPERDTGSNANRAFAPDDGLLSGRKLTEGNVLGLTILVNFSDITTTITKEDVEDLLNGDNYTENGNFCSVRRYFDIVSNGKLDYTNTVVGPVQLSKRRSYYINNLLVKEALEKAISQHGINLADFDSRDEGIVDALNLLYAGESQYSGDLWPHNSVEALQFGAMRTHFYQLTGLGSSKTDLRIGTICHENGHLLCRFPDMYDYGERDGDFEKSQGIGRYCLMGSGNHLDFRRTPSPVCGYLRELVGWADNVSDLDTAATFEADHGDYSTVMKFPTDKTNEYFIVENRTKLGLDSHLPSSGLAVYHCDTRGSNEWQQGTRNKHYQCALLQADGHLDLENNRNAGDSDDLFSDIAGIAISHDTNPASHEWDGTDSGLIVSDISVPGATMIFTVGRPQAPTVVRKSTWPYLIIPDNTSSGVVSSLEIEASGSVTYLYVAVYIIHSWISDLTVSLTSPDGTEVILHNKEGGNGDDIIKLWNSNEFPPLEDIVGTPGRGQWRLKVVDDASDDVGRLLGWNLRVDV